jgi:uncharacterized phage-associated protein
MSNAARRTPKEAGAHDVAAAFIECCAPVDALKLQKLVFLAAGEYLAMTGRTMFSEPIEAWDYGPVVHTVYKAYKGTEGNRPILTASKGDPANLNDVARGCVESVVQRFGKATGPELIRFTHEMAPWADAYSPGQYRTPIDNQAIYDYFAQAPTIEQAVEALSAWHTAQARH